MRCDVPPGSKMGTISQHSSQTYAPFDALQHTDMTMLSYCFHLPALKKKKKWEETMIGETSADRWQRFGTSCDQCSDELIAPDRSEYVSKYHVRHFWSCENCGHEFEMSVNLLGCREQSCPA